MTTPRVEEQNGYWKASATMHEGGKVCEIDARASNYACIE
jgi:hypothetical protein